MDKNIKQKKIAIFWDNRFNNNNFRNAEIDSNLKPFYDLSELNGFHNTISLNLLKDNDDKSNFIILCFLNLSFFSILNYIKLFITYPKNQKYLFLFEPPVVSPLSYYKFFHIFFDKVYTWNDNLVDNKKYIKFFYPQSNHNVVHAKKFRDKKFITLINGNKFSLGKNELYSEREKIIRYLEKSKTEFNLYGTRWDMPNLKQKILGYVPYLSYKGRVDDKIETISNYKFNICFENMEKTPGYITEKIWDSFKAKTVPIYWGASNINDYIPSNCYIDYRDYKTPTDLISALGKIDEKKYNDLITNIENFLKTPQAKKWFNSNWAKNFLNNI